MSRIVLEVCVDDAAGIAAAAAGGADRIELCSALALGGLTPSAGLMAIAGPLPAHAMIRPRAGDFCWSAAERDAMVADIAAARAAGMAGVVIGASCPDGSLDRHCLSDLVAAAEGMQITLHRAIDLVPDVREAMAICADLGIARVLSSGAEARALDGIARLSAMAGHGVTVMPGGGVSATNATEFAHRLPWLSEIHASCSMALPPPANPKITAFGFQPPGARATDVGLVRQLRRVLDQIEAARPAGWTAS